MSGSDHLLQEIPTAVSDNVTSWRRTISNAKPDLVANVLREAAIDLFRMRKVSRAVQPESDSVVIQAACTIWLKPRRSIPIPPKRFLPKASG